MKTYNETMHIIRGSKQFRFIENTVLEITDYYTGESVMLNLNAITPEILDELQIDDDDINDNEY